jgi:hypothetical protein
VAVRALRARRVAKKLIAATSAVENDTEPLAIGTLGLTAAVRSGSAVVGKFIAPIAAVATGLELGFVAACR